MGILNYRVGTKSKDNYDKTAFFVRSRGENMGNIADTSLQQRIMPINLNTHSPWRRRQKGDKPPKE